MSAEARILEPGTTEAPAGQIRHLILTGEDLFARRADRFRFLAKSHPLGDYLVFLAVLADAQQAAFDQFPALPAPDPAERAYCRRHGMPLLSAQSWRRDPAWRNGLNAILDRVAEAALPQAARETVVGLRQASAAGLEEMADRILVGDLADISPPELPFVAAALQAYWVRMATMQKEDAFGRLDQGSVCPVCGSLPSSGIIGSAAGGPGLRYLSCSLCASQWHMVRVKCSSCESTRGINHYALEGSNGAVKIESCEHCNSYLKLLYMEKDRQMEATADDLATLALDMLMDQQGKCRCGLNLFFHPGSV
jgi:FdhE protein